MHRDEGRLLPDRRRGDGTQPASLEAAGPGPIATAGARGRRHPAAGGVHRQGDATGRAERRRLCVDEPPEQSRRAEAERVWRVISEARGRERGIDLA
jgi:hypothetical protein